MTVMSTAGNGLSREIKPEKIEACDPESQRAALNEIAELLHSRGLGPAAVFVLEAMRPLAFVTAEFLTFLEPFARLFLPPDKYRLVVEAMHDRANVAWLVERLEQLAESSDRQQVDQPKSLPAAESDGPALGDGADK